MRRSGRGRGEQVSGGTRCGLSSGLGFALIDESPSIPGPTAAGAPASPGSSQSGLLGAGAKPARHFHVGRASAGNQAPTKPLEGPGGSPHFQERIPDHPEHPAKELVPLQLGVGWRGWGMEEGIART